MQTVSHTEPRVLGALLKYELNPNYTRQSVEFTNGGADPVELVPGTIFTGGATPAVFDTAVPLAFTGLCLSRITVEAGATVTVAQLVKGPAIVNANEIDFPADGGQRTTLEGEIAAVDIQLVDGLDA